MTEPASLSTPGVGSRVGHAAPTLAAVPDNLAEIRMLGSFQVRRDDGTLVDRGEWRTGKAADLVRLLALQAGEPIPVNTLVSTLWPGSDQRRGQASLRTAASQVRRVLGGCHLERSLAGLQLRGVWVDVMTFRALAVRAHQLMALGQFAGVNDAAREADSLYRGELRAYDDGAEWAQSERQALATTYQALLCDAAEAAVSLGLATDAVDFAGRAVILDPFSERASRLLMRGHAEMGELSLALREYERCRTQLADELGIDPSPQTRELHLFLLRSERPAPVARPAARPVAVPPTDDRSRSGADSRLQAEAKLGLALDVCLPQRQFVRARRYADEIAATTDDPALRAKALVISWLPGILFGRTAQVRAALGHATTLAESGDQPVLRRRIDVLECLAAHDVDACDFEARWADAAGRCEVETDVNWGWAMIRIATERGDLESALLLAGLPVAPAAGRLARQLHTLASAALRAELGETECAIHALRQIADAPDQQDLLLILPETLARLVILLAESDLAAAENYLRRLATVLDGQPILPRDAYLRLLADAAVQCARGRSGAAAAAAAGAADIAELNGLVFLTAQAHELCMQYAAKAHAGSSRAGGKRSLTLALVGR